jgi:hypothetical protein
LLYQVSKKSPLEKGAFYQRQRSYDLVEQAVVQWIGEDATGIPHVKYFSRILGLDDEPDTRFLAQSEFIRQYARCASNA